MAIASSERLNKPLRRIQSERREELNSALRALLSQPWGRLIAGWLVFDVGQAMGRSFAPAIKDGVAMAQVSAHAEGQRETALYLLEELRLLEPGLTAQMQAEFFAAQSEMADAKSRAESEPAEDQE